VKPSTATSRKAWRGFGDRLLEIARRTLLPDEMRLPGWDANREDENSCENSCVEGNTVVRGVGKIDTSAISGFERRRATYASPDVCEPVTDAKNDAK